MRRLFLCLTLACACLCMADRNRTLPGAKIETPPIIDGIVNPEEWAGGTKTSGFVHIATGEKCAFDAELYAAYDAQSVYFAFVNPDPDPKLIRATEYRRGASVEGDDYVIVLINPFATNRFDDANEFRVGAGGGMTSKFAGGRAAKREWQGEWEAKARITDKGWECEIRIPWKIFRLPPGGKRNIEVNFARYIPRAQLPISWCDIGPSEHAEYNGAWLDVDIPAVAQTKEILALPYQIVGYDEEANEAVINTGIDFRHNLSPQVTGLASINPDFRNVEGAVLNLAFSRFERLAQETRPFFVEGQEEFRMGGMTAQLFAPQRIRTFDFGMKAFGKLSDRRSFGALFTTLFEEGGSLTSGAQQSAAVMRFRSTWRNQSAFTAGATHFEDHLNGIRNSVGGAQLEEWGPRWGTSWIYNVSDDDGFGVGSRFDFDLMFKDNQTNASIGWQDIQSDFIPRIGFAPRVGYRGVNGFVESQRQFTHGPWTKAEGFLFVMDTQNERGGGVFIRSQEASLSAVTREGLNMELGCAFENFQGQEARFYSTGLEYPDQDPYHKVALNATLGNVDGADYSLYSLSGNYRFPSKITITPMLQWEKLGNEKNTLHVIGLSYEIDAYQSVGGRAVIRNESTNWYLAYRRSGNLGIEYYVILGDPNADSFQRRLIVKVVFPVTLRI